MPTKLAQRASCRNTWQVRPREILECRAAIVRGQRKVSWMAA
jgi:hypothetical protein